MWKGRLLPEHTLGDGSTYKELNNKRPIALLDTHVIDIILTPEHSSCQYFISCINRVLLSL